MPEGVGRAEGAGGGRRGARTVERAAQTDEVSKVRALARHDGARSRHLAKLLGDWQSSNIDDGDVRPAGVRRRLAQLRNIHLTPMVDWDEPARPKRRAHVMQTKEDATPGRAACPGVR